MPKPLHAIGLLALSASGALFAGCRGRGVTAGSSADAAEPALAASASATASVAPSVACTGAALSLFAAVLAEACAVTNREWDELRSKAVDAGKSSLVQRARRDGDHVVLSLVNVGTAPAVVPLRFRPASVELPPLSVLAEDDKHAVFELAAPAFVLDVDAGPSTAPKPKPGPRDRESLRDAAVEHVHSARIVLAPGGAAEARVVIDPRVVRRLDRPCDDAGACGRDGRLTRGHYTLYVGQLVAAIDAGPPAALGWDQP